ncbi:MAG: 16S rRNA (cytosine(1402)-N(4))-methyltransferase RsmH [Planctomycetes bacterium]|nr:16S rRNA (cytosine(1402)-N(4))-methyltransferase RsmH [Planctomycetota bacterium]MCW8135803.1 16S rRNA (cytosine(1402)-N(4))-methyltransferase RsmH [Planctomycetota bacterium]
MADKPARRKRYRGTHPRAFDEKYKELDPQAYPDEHAKVRAQGRTPAATHVPILLAEVMAALSPGPDKVIVDCTLGYGGHSQAMAQAGARVIGLDLDTTELARTRARLGALGLDVSTHNTNFAGVPAVLAQLGLNGVHGLLADLGVSSMQLDDPRRGFGFKHEGPLDMRMDATRGKGAAQLIADLPEPELAELLSEHGDEPRAAEIARSLKRQQPTTSKALAALVLRAHGLDPSTFRGHGKHPAARVFQALRIAVNREAANLAALLRVLPQVLLPGGVAAIISFHSGEERAVRGAFKDYLEQGVLAQAELTGIKPSRQEVHDNPRARSARLFFGRRAP